MPSAAQYSPESSGWRKRAGAPDKLIVLCSVRLLAFFFVRPDLKVVIEPMAKYGKMAERKVAKAMRERKKGTLKSGRSGKKVTSRKQAIAIGLSEARKRGGKVPAKKTGRKAVKKMGRKPARKSS